MNKIMKLKKEVIAKFKSVGQVARILRGPEPMVKAMKEKHGDKIEEEPEEIIYIEYATADGWSHREQLGKVVEDE